MSQITNHRYTIEGAFRECFYVVPDYQREYIWKPNKVTRLLEDINEQIDTSTSEYFIGTTIVFPSKDGKYHIIDGQQRLTTIFLILCALRALCSEDLVDYIGRLLKIIKSTSTGHLSPISLTLKPQDKNAEEVMEKIFDTKGDSAAVKASIQDSEIPFRGSVENILNAYEAIYHFLTETYDGEDKLIKYWGHLAHQVIFIQISTPIGNVLKVFETINTRGVGLNAMDLLKTLLFMQVPEEKHSQLTEAWKNKITTPFEKEEKKKKEKKQKKKKQEEEEEEENQENQERVRFLRYFLMANYRIENDRKDSIVRENEIYDWFSKNDQSYKPSKRSKRSF